MFFLFGGKKNIKLKLQTKTHGNNNNMVSQWKLFKF